MRVNENSCSPRITDKDHLTIAQINKQINKKEINRKLITFQFINNNLFN